MLNQKIEYIHYDPVKRALVAEPEHWIYSSAGDFILNRWGVVELQDLPVSSAKPSFAEHSRPGLCLGRSRIEL